MVASAKRIIAVIKSDEEVCPFVNQTKTLGAKVQIYWQHRVKSDLRKRLKRNSDLELKAIIKVAWNKTVHNSVNSIYIS